MSRLSTLFWLLLVSAAGFAMFAVKYEVQALDDELTRTRKAAAAEQHEIRVLDAEWAYLTRPDTLEDMNRRFLSLGPIATNQLRTGIAELPMRPVPPAPVNPAPDAVAVAAGAPSAALASPEALPVGAAVSPLASAQQPADPAPIGEPPPAAAATAPKPVLAAAAIRPAVVKAAAKREAPRHPKSLDELITQIAASR